MLLERNCLARDVVLRNESFWLCGVVVLRYKSTWVCGIIVLRYIDSDIFTSLGVGQRFSKACVNGGYLDSVVFLGANYQFRHSVLQSASLPRMRARTTAARSRSILAEVAELTVLNNEACIF